MTVPKATSRLTAGKVRQRAEILEALDGLQRLGAVTSEEMRQAERQLTTTTQGPLGAEPAPTTSPAERNHVVIK